MERTENEHPAPLRFLESLDRIERAIRKAESLEETMENVLETALSIFECDRAWLMYPCDPQAEFCQVPMERNRPEYPGAFLLQRNIPVTPELADSFRAALNTKGPVVLHPDVGLPLPDSAKEYSIKSSMNAALFPKIRKPWLWGLSQCSHARTWSEEDRALFQEIGHRLSDSLNSLLLLGDLQASEERYRLLAENVSDVIWTLSLNQRFDYVSPSVEAILGFAPHEVTGRLLEEFLTPEALEIAVEVLARELARDNEEGHDPSRSVNLELEHKCKDGSTLWAEVKASFLRDTHGNPIGVLGITRDISERKKVEDELRKSEANYRAIFNAANDGVFVHDIKTGEILDTNQRMTEMYGYAPEEARTLTVEAISSGEPPYTQNGAINNIRLASQGKPQLFEWLARHKNGKLFWVEVNLKRAEIGGRDRLLAVVRDISERKQAEEALKAEKEFSTSLIENAPTFFFAVSKHGKTIMMNRAMLQVLDYDAEDVVGKDFLSNFVSERDREQLSGVFEALGTEHKHTLNESHIVSKDGKEFLIEWRGAPVFDENGKFVSLYGIGTDITERKRLEEQLLRSQKMEAVGTLAGGIAHDFNNLLHVIQGYADIALLDLREGDKYRSELVEIRNAAKSASELTQSLLTFSRRVESSLRPVDLNQELEQVVRMLKRTVPKMIDMELRLDKGLKLINADPAQLQQVVMNLAVNARDAMPNGGRLVIETKNVSLDEQYVKLHGGTQPGEHVMLSVADTGRGMKKETVERIFEPFFTTKQVGQGTGLGLAIVYGIVKNHGGGIDCYSEPGQGTTFKIFLPSIDRTLRNDDIEQKNSPVGGTETILIIDDEKQIRKLGEQILIMYGYSVLTASNGRQGLEIFVKEKKRIDLIILDLIMPEMGGRECLMEILKIDPSAKVLIASGYAADEEIETSIEEGAKASIRKPYETHQLLEKVRQVLDRI